MSKNKTLPLPGGMHQGPQQQHFGKGEKPRNVLNAVLRLAAYLRRQKARLALVFAFAVLTALITVAGTRLNGYTVDRFISTGDSKGLLYICLALLGMYLVGAFSTWWQNTIMVTVSQHVSAHIRKDLFSALQTLPLAYFDKNPSGDLMSRMTNDVDNVSQTLAQGIAPLFSGVVMIAGMLAAMFVLSVPLTLVVLLSVPLMILSTRAVVRFTRSHFSAQQRELGALNAYVEEMISGQKTLSLFSREELVKERFTAINDAYVRSSVKAQGYSGLMGPVNNTVNNISYLAVTVAGSIIALRTGSLSVGTIFAFILFMRNFTRPINDIMNLSTTLLSALAGAERVFEVMDSEAERDDPGAEDLSDIAGYVNLENVKFSYVPGKPVLKGMHLVARQGQTVAIVGPTGAGKTTIISLLPKFYGCQEGRILIDGRDLSSITAGSLRKSITLVSQDPFLFSVSVRENLRYGKPGAADAEVESAAKKARAHDFILQLPQGYDTVLVDNGSSLSQGQRQLLSIARAAIADSAILILDEATSSIDTRTELLVQEALLELMRGRTTFVIAHRLSTIRKANLIAVVHDGIIAESGSHEELMAARGEYFNMYESQFKTGITEPD